MWLPQWRDMEGFKPFNQECASGRYLADGTLITVAAGFAAGVYEVFIAGAPAGLEAFVSVNVERLNNGDPVSTVFKLGSGGAEMQPGVNLFNATASEVIALERDGNANVLAWGVNGGPQQILVLKRLRDLPKNTLRRG